MIIQDLKTYNIALERALAQFYYECASGQPDLAVSQDDWWSTLSPELDLNLWVDEYGELRATLYDVIDGNTLTVDKDNQLNVRIPDFTRRFVVHIRCYRDGSIFQGGKGVIQVTRASVEFSRLVIEEKVYAYTPEREEKIQSVSIASQQKISVIDYNFSITARNQQGG